MFQTLNMLFTITSALLDLSDDGLDVVKRGQGQNVGTDWFTGCSLQFPQVVVTNSNSKHSGS